MDKIDELLTRGVDKIYPTKEDLEKVLRSGKILRVYQGFDPTNETLHIGHMLGLKKLQQWQKLGHKVIFLIGDFTAMVGDPSGKTTARKILTHEEVIKNAKNYKTQAEKILDFEGSNPVEIKYNGDWLSKMSALDFLKLSHNLTYNQIAERDLFQERQKKGEDVYLNEFLYPLMQAYDSVAMDVDVEIGGTDQTFNMLMGRKLMRNILKKDKFVMTTPLLTDSSGAKIGKTEGNVIALNDIPEDLYGKIMALGDDVITKGLEYLTNVSMEEIAEIKNKLDNGENPITFKKRLSFEIIKELYGESEAQNAETVFRKVVQNKGLPDKIPLIDLSGYRWSYGLIDIVDVLLKENIVESKSQAKSLIIQKGVSIDKKIIDKPSIPSISLENNKEHILKAKNRLFRLVVK